MLTTLLIIAFAEILIILADITNRNKPAISWALLTTCILTLCFFAAVRDNTCGIDIYVYEYGTFRTALFVDSFSALHDKIDLDFFFLIINYVAAVISDKLGSAFFLIELAVSTFSILACYTLRKRIPMWITALPFLFCFYPLSYNIMRQSIAIAFLTWAVALLLDSGNLKRFILMVVIGAFFHKTSVLAGVPIAYIYWATYYLNDRKRLIAMLVFVGGSLSAVILANLIFKYLAEQNQLFEHFLMYLGGKDGYRRGFNKFCIMFDLTILFVCGFAYIYKLKDSKIIILYSSLLYLDLLFQSLGVFSVFATRLGMYTSALHLFIFPTLVTSPKITQKTSYCLIALSLVLTVLYGIRMFQDTGRAVPYKSEILGI